MAGLTLIEVLVSLTIVSVAVLGLARSASNTLDAQHQLEITTLGTVVARNVLADMELMGNLTASRRQGETDMANRQWYWEALISPTPDGSMLRVDVGVYDRFGAERPVVLQTGFVAP